MGKSISNLYRYAEVSKACNIRFPDSLVDIVPVNSVQQEISSVCSGKTVKGKLRQFSFSPSSNILKTKNVYATLSATVFSISCQAKTPGFHATAILLLLRHTLYSVVSCSLL